LHGPSDGVADSVDEAKAAVPGGVAAEALKWQTKSTSLDSKRVSMLGTRGTENG
jgi:hypothetical protein